VVEWLELSVTVLLFIQVKYHTLKRFKDDVKEVSNGYECGIMFEKFNDIQVGDYIETFIQIKEQASI